MGINLVQLIENSKPVKLKDANYTSMRDVWDSMGSIKASLLVIEGYSIEEFYEQMDNRYQVFEYKDTFFYVPTAKGIVII